MHTTSASRDEQRDLIASTGVPSIAATIAPITGLFPLAAFLTLTLGGGLLFVLAQSLGFAPWYGINSFPDFAHYRAMIDRPEFLQSTWLTVAYASVATVIALVLGTGLALSLRATAATSAFVQRLVALPLVVSYGVGVALAVLILGNGGVLSRLVAALGVIDQPGDFPRLIQTHAGYGVVAVFVWKQIPFVAISVLGVLAKRSRDIEDAARVLGASRRLVLTDVVLPTIAPALSTAALISFAFNIGAFEAPLILGAGHPRTLPVIVWELMSDQDHARQLEAMAAVVLMASIVVLASATNLLVLRRFTKSGARDD
jgi:putative spermidine/putrescine transport system permease protein